MPVTPIAIEVIQRDFESDRRFRERRHSQWTMNYTLYRNRSERPNRPIPPATNRRGNSKARSSRERSRKERFEVSQAVLEDIGNIFVGLIMANGKDMTAPVLDKKSPTGVYFKKTLNLSNTDSKEGYRVKVGSKADKESDSLETIKKMQARNAAVPAESSASEDLKQNSFPTPSGLPNITPHQFLPVKAKPSPSQ